MTPLELQRRTVAELEQRVEMIAIVVNDLRGIEAVLGPDAGGPLRAAVEVLWAYYGGLLAATRAAGWTAPGAEMPASPSQHVH